jgi:hypothetical protein
MCGATSAKATLNGLSNEMKNLSWLFIFIVPT